MIIKGLAIGGYRSFGARVQQMGPFEKINLFIGPNNSGKSNILRFIHQHYAALVKHVIHPGNAAKFLPVDRHISSGPTPFTFGLAGEIEAICRNFSDGVGYSCAKEILLRSPLHTIGDCAMFLYEAPAQGDRPQLRLTEMINFFVSRHEEFRPMFVRLLHAIGGIGSGDFAHIIAEATNKFVGQVDRSPPNIEFVPAFRQEQKSAGEATSENFGGLGLVRRLHRLQSPNYENHGQDYPRFQTINAFVKTVTENESASIEIPHDADSVQVHMDGKRLPLESLGTGIHEVVMLGVAATVVQKSILCIEEPELHLHPLLQRKLLAYLSEKTENQYFITTHSAHFLDTERIAVFRVQLEEGQTTVTRATTPREKREICDDLVVHSA